MAIRFISMKCPQCNADLDVEEGRKELFCSYCGTKIMVQNDNEFYIHHIDEVGVKKAETERMVKMRQLDIEEIKSTQGMMPRKILTSIWIVLTLIIIVICIYKMAFTYDSFDGLIILVYLGIPVVWGGGYFVFKYLPEKETEMVLLSNGGIRFPKEIFPYSERNYEDVLIALKNAGFQNVNCVNMHDVIVGILQKPGKVESISVNGETITEGGKIYLPTVLIIITYHGM